jgi:hypothetical protein
LCPPPPPSPSSSLTAAFRGTPVLCPRDSLRPPASRNPKSTDPPTPLPPAKPSVCRRRPSERDRLPPRPTPASGAPHPHTPCVGLLHILLLCAILPDLQGSTAAARLAALRVVASARASTSPPRPAASTFSLTVVLPNAGRGVPPSAAGVHRPCPAAPK